LYHRWLHHQEGLTLLLLALLGAIFLKGLKEAIGIAVFLVAIYLTINLVVVSVAVVEVLKHPQTIAEWKQQLWHQQGSVWLMLGVSTCRQTPWKSTEIPSASSLSKVTW
jgi:hypothetical protein